MTTLRFSPRTEQKRNNRFAYQTAITLLPLRL